MGVAQGGSDFTLVQGPGAGNLASLTRSAGSNGTRHVIDTLSATISTGATALSAQTQLYVRDGASGAGPIIFALTIFLPANAVWSFSVPLRLVGSPNTPMTVEFNVAPPAGAFESFTATGHEEN